MLARTAGAVEGVEGAPVLGPGIVLTILNGRQNYTTDTQGANARNTKYI